MKKTSLILIFLIGIISCKENSTKDVWIAVKDKSTTSKNGYRSGNVGLILDFEKLEVTNLSFSKDSIEKFKLDYKNREIVISENDSIKYKFQFYGKDSLEFQIKEFNTTTVLIPLNLNFELQLSKNEIVNQIIERKIETIRDTLILEFTETFFKDTYFTKEIEDKRVLKSKFLEYEENLGYWYIGEKNENYFLAFNLKPYHGKEFIYQITEFKKEEIKLDGILTEGFISRITELKTSL